MYFIYIDESGEKNPSAKLKREEPFVLTALALHEYQWKRFEQEINEHKLRLIRQINKRECTNLELADAEVHSSDLRIRANKNKHPFLKYLSDQEIYDLVKLYYSQLSKRHFTIFAVITDKTKLNDFMDHEKLLKKAYELLLERGERFIADEQKKHNAIFVLDNTSKQINRSIAMKHSYFLRSGTTSGLKLKHVVEIPFFVESYLSNGVQLADLTAYNIFRAFKDKDVNYEYFLKILPYFHTSKRTREQKIDGLKVFPEEHKWVEFLKEIEIKRACLKTEQALKLTSGSFKEKDIEPT